MENPWKYIFMSILEGILLIIVVVVLVYFFKQKKGANMKQDVRMGLYCLVAACAAIFAFLLVSWTYD